MHEYDKSSKWLIQHHGDSILRLGGIREIESWTPLQAEIVQSRRLPDGLIEVRYRGRAMSDPFVLEIATYPEARVAEQVVGDTALVFLDRRVVPDVLVLFLRPRGKATAAGSATLRSRGRLTKWDVSWRAVKLWEVPAEQLLAAGDVGLIPWVPLAQFDRSPEAIVRECRTRIDRDAPPGELENMLAVTQVLAGLRYNDPKLFQILGGRKAMIESPVLRELKEEWTREATREAAIEDLTTVLVARFGAKAGALEAELKAIDDASRLKELIKLAATARTLSSFRKQLTP
jgi:predicted transposase YdaD